MDNNNPMSMLYHTLLSVPGMNENVKIDLKVSRKQVLLLCAALESGLLQKSEETAGMLSAMPEEAESELKQFVGECLEKAGLTELKQKLRSFPVLTGK